MIAQADFNIHNCPIAVNVSILHAENVLNGCKDTKKKVILIWKDIKKHFSTWFSYTFCIFEERIDSYNNRSLRKQKSPPRGTKGMITRQLDGRKLLPFRLVESEELDNVV